MELGKTKSVVVKLSYSQVHKLLGMSLIDYTKYYLLGVANDRENRTSS